ncbi:MAG: nicotinamide-nucleotide amidohydrolase family protein [Candidatus Omnitrophica bacterium]|nr:nicotinamide-nucleotide amidohydrolase family protein [Candidatus Omnitrophota bacterium]
MTFERVVHNLFTSNGLTLAGAESCTGGLVSARITNVPGSSSYFKGSVIAYSNSAKVSLLEVPASVIMRSGAVNPITAKKMALGARKVFGSDVAFSLTGIAGPGGASAAKPVGLAFIAVATRRGERVKRVIFKGSRAVLKRLFAEAAFKFLVETVSGEYGNTKTKKRCR